jgi:hypothetical protein
MIHYLVESCERQGIDLIPHGVGKVFAGWANTMYFHTLEAMREFLAEEYTHVLQVDGVDSIIICPLSEIIAKYVSYGAPPCLMSSDCEAYPPHLCTTFTGDMRWKYLNAGCFITEIQYYLELIEKLHALYPNEGNNQAWLVQQWPIDGMVLDHSCDVFQSMDHTVQYEISCGRLINTETGGRPCVLHFRGGYSSPENGRDDRMTPVVEQLYGN